MQEIDVLEPGPLSLALNHLPCKFNSGSCLNTLSEQIRAVYSLYSYFRKCGEFRHRCGNTKLLLWDFLD